MLVKKTASCADMLAWFEQNGRIVTDPQPGDIVFFKYKTNNRRTNHVGLVTVVKGKEIETNEGNTSINSDDNGGSVMKRKRSSNIVAFARPLYSSEKQKQDILKRAEGEVGVKESPPNSNNVKYNTWFYKKQVSGSNYPWCAVYISWLFDDSSESNTPRATIRKGSTGNDVLYLQKLLHLKEDGIFGLVTDASVRIFQKDNNLIVDGVVGPNTWAKLEETK